jgi:metacaspase-1
LTDLLRALEAAHSDEERERVLLDATIQRRNPEIREGIWCAAVPHWFDASFLGALLGRSADAVLDQIKDLSIVEQFPERGFNVHERSRVLLLKKLWEQDPSRALELHQRAAEYCTRQDQNQIGWLAETFYHQLIVGEPRDVARFVAQTRRLAEESQFDKLDALVLPVLNDSFLIRNSFALRWAAYLKGYVDRMFVRYDDAQIWIEKALSLAQEQSNLRELIEREEEILQEANTLSNQATIPPTLSQRARSMPRAMSIHIGVNQPEKRFPGLSLQWSESTAWGMAAVAERAGYDSLLVLRGAHATRRAVDSALADAAGKLVDGDNLFVSFSGHGTQDRDIAFDFAADRDRGGFDEAWCLFDDVLEDDQLTAYWRLFEPGVRILVVSESCFVGGMGRYGDDVIPYGSAARGAQPVQPILYRASPDGAEGAGDGAMSCVEPPMEANGIQASLLLLTASREDQYAHDGVFARHLFEVWNNGAFPGSYCDLYRQVRDRVVAETVGQEPRIQLFGAADPEFALAHAFHVERGKPRAHLGYR